MKICIIAIGDELLIGQVTDTNSGFIARSLQGTGWEVGEVNVISDERNEIFDTIKHALDRYDVIVTTGGLGPTRDDITKSVLMDVFGGELKLNDEVSDHVKKIFERRGLVMNSLTAAQALVPSTCTVLPNDYGTAPVMCFEKDGKVLVALPGVPFEMQGCWTNEVFPWLVKRFTPDIKISHRTFLVTGITESDLAIKLSSFEDALPSFMHLAYLPKQRLIRLRLDGRHVDTSTLDSEFYKQGRMLRDILGDLLLAEEDIAIEVLLNRLLKEKGLLVSTAESCTGGKIASMITSVPGSSSCYAGGIVAYSNDIKTGVLGVKEETILNNGAVSVPTVEQMCEGVAHITGSECAIATSGIAGPTGGTPDKPVGTVCIAVKAGNKRFSHTYRFNGNRERIVEQSAVTAMIGLCELLKTY